jgi:eukaryotic-like serine/threonine-protein kinase
MRIGSYEVVRELGRGGMGVVYAVRSDHIPGLRALKLLLNAADAAAVIRFRREAELMARVRHQGIVPIHEVGESEAGLYLVMDLVEGEPVDEVLRRGPVDPERARRWILEVADAVGALHAAGLLHRDLKPANLMLRPDGSLLLLDFGLARKAGRSSLTNTGAIAGSPGYMAPEQAEGLADLAPAVDVHGLGAILYALLTGAAPFQGGSVLAQLRSVLDDVVEWPASCPRDLVHVGRKALAKLPSDRQPDAASFAAELRSLAAGPALEPRPGAGRLLLALGAVLLLLASALGLLGSLGAEGPSPSAKTPPSPAPSAPPTSPTPISGRDWSRIPQDRTQRPAWYRDLWRSLPDDSARLEELRRLRKPLRLIQDERLLDLSVTVNEGPEARFWGDTHWVRQRADALDWRRWDSPDEDPQIQAIPLGRMQIEEGVLWTFDYGAWQVWRSPEPGAALKQLELPLPMDQSARHGLKLVTIAPRGDTLAMASQSCVWQWTYPKGALETLFVSTANEIVQLGFTAGGRLVARAKAPGRSRIFEPRRSFPSGTFTTQRADCLAFHPSEELVVVGEHGGALSSWDLEQEHVSKVWQSNDLELDFCDVAFGPRGDLIYAVCFKEGQPRSGTLRVWRKTERGWDLTRTKRLGWEPMSVVVSPDGAWLLASGKKGHAELWAAGDLGD